ncbi:MAG: diphthine--ammonia ligase [Rikenellaceae bacterium]
MKVFVSWSGGKDCSLALYKFKKSNPDAEIVALLNMNRATTQNAHRLTGDLVKSQADAMGVKLHRETVGTEHDYTYYFQKAVKALKEQGAEYGVFGDIYLETHLNWITKQCEELGIKPIFPLLNIDVHDLYNDFIEAGFVAKVVSVKNDHKFAALLSQNLSMEIYHQMLEHEGFDVCGENGEYHSFVIDGPTFQHPVEYAVVGEYKDEKLHALELDIPRP